MPRWSNWSGRQTAAPVRIVRPTTEAGFVDAVRDAGAAGLTVRAVGASHSHSRVAAPDGGLLVDTDGWQGVITLDETATCGTVRSGTRIFQLGAPLHAAGLALRNQGDIDRQSVAGAIATGTHGTGVALQNLSASVTGVRVVLASGDVVDCDAAVEPDLFEVARHSLGGVGLVTTVRLALRDAYRLHEVEWREEPASVVDRIDELTGATRHFEFFWMPQIDRCACKSLAETDAPSDPLPHRPYERIGWSHEIISSIRDVKHTEMEYSVPAERGPTCFMELRELVLTRFGELQWPLEYRTLAPDDVWISTARDRPTVTISAHQDIALDDRPLFEACEEVFARHHGRPHWGKVHGRSGAELVALHRRYRDWWAVRDRYDPDERFVTAHLRALRP